MCKNSSFKSYFSPWLSNDRKMVDIRLTWFWVWIPVGNQRWKKVEFSQTSILVKRLSNLEIDSTRLFWASDHRNFKHVLPENQAIFFQDDNNSFQTFKEKHKVSSIYSIFPPFLYCLILFTKYKFYFTAKWSIEIECKMFIQTLVVIIGFFL